MRVILSRKGFDSSSGGIKSPIFEDGTMISLPIPEKNDEDKYEDLVYKDFTLAEILKMLHYKNDVFTSHLDPDLTKERRKNTKVEWCSVFGQCGPAASYLLSKDNPVKEGDLFLFFGRYHFVENNNGTLNYVKNSNDFYKDNDLHVIWGYMQIGKIIEEKQDILNNRDKYYWHPHTSEYYNNGDKKNTPNVLFVARKELSFNPSMPGAGILKYDQKRVLTNFKSNMATWIKKSFYDNCSIIGNRKNSAKDQKNGLYYQGQWQELKLKESLECEEWAKKIIED
jgi:hypothetical protein